jgi:hypothetical protein
MGAPVAFVIYRRYVGVLGAGERPNGSPERLAYDELCENLSGDNLAARLYAKSLSAFLDAVDRFFGDAGKADQTLFPRAFGLNTPAPLWTAPAFDRCLLLAVFYPFLAIIVIWAISGHVGPAEAAFGLAPNISDWRRGLVAALFALGVFFFAWPNFRVCRQQFCSPCRLPSGPLWRRPRWRWRCRFGSRYRASSRWDCRFCAGR